MRIAKKVTNKTIGVAVALSLIDAQATNRLAIPPTPLNKLTISGIDVIAIKRAAKIPTNVPANNANAIHSKLKIL